jgi:hypothetical protein
VSVSAVNVSYTGTRFPCRASLEKDLKSGWIINFSTYRLGFRDRGKTKNSVILSEAKNLSLFLFP